MKAIPAVRSLFFPSIGKSYFRLKTRIRCARSFLGGFATKRFLSRLVASPAAQAGALLASGVWAVAVLYWGL